MSLAKSRYWILALVAIIAIAGTVSAIVFNQASADVLPGTIDDGADLLPQASITLEEAITAAQAAESGALGEVDLEYYEGTLVFNVDIGEWDVKVDEEDVRAAPLEHHAYEIQGEGESQPDQDAAEEPFHEGHGSTPRDNVRQDEARDQAAHQVSPEGHREVLLLGRLLFGAEGPSAAAAC